MEEVAMEVAIWYVNIFYASNLWSYQTNIQAQST